MKTFYFTLTMFAALLALNGCHQAQSGSVNPISESIPVKVAAVHQQLSNEEIHTSGQFTTDDETFLSFKTGGIIKQILVKEGDLVRKGQVVATLYQNEIDAQVQQARIAYEKAQRDYQRYGNLYKDSVVTLEQFQNTKTAFEIAQQQLSAVRFNQNYSVIRATASGYVLKKLAGAGQLVSAGEPVVQINGAKQSAWILKVAVSDQQWSAIKIGDTAMVNTDALQQTLKAKVIGKTEGVDISTGTFTVNLELTEKSTTSIATGLFGKAIIYPSAKMSAWFVPYDAITDGDGGVAYVFATSNFKTVTKVKVKVVAVSNGTATITEGLEKITTLVVSGSAYLKDGASITITNDKQEL
jgi:RND family efflux transporter MFP subunit